MRDRDSVPELIVYDERSKRRTVEFCVLALDGHRCMLVKGHDGAHEAIGNRGPVRWLLTPDE